MKKHLLIAAGILLMCCAGSASAQEYKAITTKGTLIRTSAADPCMVYSNGVFFLTMTGSTKIAMVHDRDLNCLTTNLYPSAENIIYDGKYDPTVEEMYGEGALLSGTWSPEIHYISEEDCPGCSGWYIFFALRQKLDNSRNVRTVVMKSRTGKVEGPYGHPVSRIENCSQTLLGPDGSPLTIWNIGMSLLKIPSGKYQGIYGTYVDEVGRGSGVKGQFYQRLRIAKLKSPWQLGGELHTITTPTQAWEKKGSSAKYPEVVEGGTAVYGKNGEVFLTYCGSGFWSDYGLGQLTLLKGEDGDYLDPLESSSWVKYEGNPIFTSNYSDELRGAGHAFFLKDDAGNDFMIYHAYPFDGEKKEKIRHSYMEPYYIDYDNKSESAPYGVIVCGALRDGRTAPTDTPVTFLVNKKKPKKK